MRPSSQEQAAACFSILPFYDVDTDSSASLFLLMGQGAAGPLFQRCKNSEGRLMPFDRASPIRGSVSSVNWVGAERLPVAIHPFCTL